MLYPLFLILSTCIIQTSLIIPSRVPSSTSRTPMLTIFYSIEVLIWDSPDHARMVFSGKQERKIFCETSPQKHSGILVYWAHHLLCWLTRRHWYLFCFLKHCRFHDLIQFLWHPTSYECSTRHVNCWISSFWMVTQCLWLVINIVDHDTRPAEYLLWHFEVWSA